MNKRKYYPAAVALYITYFILGISATIVGQYKQEFAAAWGAERLADGTFEISRVMAVIAAIGLGRLVAFPVAGPFSDSFGRKKSALVGMAFFIVFFVGLPFTTNTAAAYICLCAAESEILFWIPALRRPAWKFSVKTVQSPIFSQSFPHPLVSLCFRLSLFSSATQALHTIPYFLQ